MMVKCRVLPNNRYGKDARAGAIVDVDEKDYVLAKHCLISLDDEKKQAASVAAAPKVATRKPIEGYQEMFRAQLQQTRERHAITAARETAAAVADAKKSKA